MIDLRRVTDRAGAEECDVLFTEYVRWVGEELEARHGLVVDHGADAAVNEAFRKDWPKLLADPGRLYLAVADGASAGVAALKPVSAAEAELKRLYVRPDHRSHGIAARLLQRIVDDARSEGFSSILLESIDFMHAAHALYRRFGFVEVEPFDGREGAVGGVDRFEIFLSLDLTTVVDPV